MLHNHSLMESASESVASPARNPPPRNPGEQLLSPEDWLLVAARLKLTTRELTVAILIFEGNSRYQIARRLNRAASTVRVYIDRLFAKLDVQDRVGLVLRVVRVHLELKAA